MIRILFKVEIFFLPGLKKVEPSVEFEAARRLAEVEAVEMLFPEVEAAAAITIESLLVDVAIVFMMLDFLN